MWMCCIKWIFFLRSHSFRKKSWSQLHAWIKWLWFRLFPRTFSIPAKFIFSSVPQALAFEERLPVHCTVLFLSSVLPFEHYSVACGTISFVRIAEEKSIHCEEPFEAASNVERIKFGFNGNPSNKLVFVRKQVKFWQTNEMKIIKLIRRQQHREIRSVIFASLNFIISIWWVRQTKSTHAHCNSAVIRHKACLYCWFIGIR